MVLIIRPTQHTDLVQTIMLHTTTCHPRLDVFVGNIRTPIKLRSNDRFDTFFSSSYLFSVYIYINWPSCIPLIRPNALACKHVEPSSLLRCTGSLKYGHSSCDSHPLTCGIGYVTGVHCNDISGRSLTSHAWPSG